MRTIIPFISAQVSSCHQILYRVFGLSLSTYGKAYDSPPRLPYQQIQYNINKIFYQIAPRMPVMSKQNIASFFHLLYNNDVII